MTSMFEVSWDTSSLTDGDYTLTFRVTDSGSKTTTDSVLVTTNNNNLANIMHMESLSGATSSGKGGKWNAEITATVFDSSESPQSNATVTGSWSQGATGSNSCTTDAQGSCTIIKNNIRRNSANATFTVNSVSHPIVMYATSANHAGADTIMLVNPN